MAGWAVGGRYGVERYAYALHRLTGLGILLYFLLHIFVTGTRVMGEETWRATMAFFSQPAFHVGEYLLFLAVAYHGLNGLRLILTELGWFLGKPKQPVYPYPNCLGRQRSLLFLAMILAFLFIVLGTMDFFGMKG